MNTTLAEIQVADPGDVTRARRVARELAAALGFPIIDQFQIAASLAEALRESLRSRSPIRVVFSRLETPVRQLRFEVIEAASAAPDREGSIRGPEDEARPEGEAPREGSDSHSPPAFVLERPLPLEFLSPSPETLRALAGSASLGEAPVHEDHHLLGLLEDCRVREGELTETKLTLADARRGVVALAAELTDQANRFERLKESKTRLLANVSHELRTPLSSILGLARLLLDRDDGELSYEQERQVGFIVDAATDMSTLVDDLIRLARAETGLEVVRPREVCHREMFGTLRGMTEPLVPVDSRVVLKFEEKDGLPKLVTDESKLIQVLWNLLTNALQFTPTGEIRLKADLGSEERSVVFSVIDTGVGIAPEFQSRVFEEFGQAPVPWPRGPKGLGLGLPLARRLVELLAGRIDLESVPGLGSQFRVTLPLIHPNVASAAPSRG
jgi:signal transduction histidine kinase